MPMGTKGNGNGVRGLGLGVCHRRCLVLLFGKKQAEEQLLTHFTDGWTKARHMHIQNQG